MKTLLNVKVDLQTKKDAQKLAKEMGLSLSAVVNGNLKSFITERAVYFEAPLKPTEKLEKILEKAEKDSQAGRNIDGPFSTIEEIRSYLRT